MTKMMFRSGVAALLLAGTFFAVVGKLQFAPRQTVSAEIRIALPLFVQVIMSMGDRNLAANLAATRAMVTSPERMHPEDFPVLAKVQKDVSWLNPAHEDNYYTAFAILPIYGELDAAQTILARASRARFFDFQPAFFYAFNLFYLKHDPEGASAWLRESAEKLVDDNQRLDMQNFAARWIDKSEDLDLAISVVGLMAQQAKRKDFRAYLEMRVRRLEMLKQLRTAAATYSKQTGRAPERLADLVEAGFLSVLPQDPFGFGFEFDSRGVIMLRTSPPKS
jgi:hypothetical protein